jgi:DNA-binding transcriptional LysR family regulator
MPFCYDQAPGVELRHLRYFATIAEVSNFTKAAERLHVTQPALSRQMRDLEEEVGCNLFDRVNNGVRLTANGRKFLIGARRLLAASESLLATMRGQSSGECPPLRIAHFGTLSAQYFSPYLRKLMRRHPSLKLHVDEELPGVALQQVRSGLIDAAFMGEPEPARLRGLESGVIWASDQEIIVSANHPLAKRRSVRLSELGRERWGVWNERQFPGFGRLALEHLRRSGIRPKVVATHDSLASAFIHVAEGDFISYVPVFARNLPHPGVVFLPTDPPGTMNLLVLLVWRPDSPHRAALRWLADTMAATARPVPPRTG